MALTPGLRYASTHALRSTQVASTGRQNLVGTITAVTYWCAIVSAPLAGAYVISQNASQDKRFANLRPLSFRDCLPSSSLDDYAGAFARTS
ncbi:unnamed protein product [Zymoseptoria tritici ST99CH_1A5]|uniref:Uncharacterized protein n=2 Tax=Zymoseptoria tritici TaxID=1047171 RepID=A0A1X7S179_ZYMT9|nr:unnamed protein product [Zymoseptoria tritici ST99CH_3D7]SMR59832.1 unnamed protein product [Zymoseptoria tritici ST99CH_3D1]SMY27021.1 unnamed protein product [Zymoseptoria tritici ST99CH_1A5]